MACIPRGQTLSSSLRTRPFSETVGHRPGVRPAFKSAARFGNRVRAHEAGLPEGLSAHGMRKAATHWRLRNHRDLIPNSFALKTIFGWVTDKELNRYTRDFDREAEAMGMLIKLNERRSLRR